MRGVIPPLFLQSSWREEGKLRPYLHIQFLDINTYECVLTYWT